MVIQVYFTRKSPSGFTTRSAFIAHIEDPEWIWIYYCGTVNENPTTQLNEMIGACPLRDGLEEILGLRYVCDAEGKEVLRDINDFLLPEELESIRKLLAIYYL